MAVVVVIGGCAPLDATLDGDGSDGTSTDVWGGDASDKGGQSAAVAAALSSGAYAEAVCGVLNPCTDGAQNGVGSHLCMDFAGAQAGDDLSEWYLVDPNHGVPNRIRIGAFPLAGSVEDSVLDHDPDQCDQGTFMAFDSSNPTGGDPDLGTPNELYGGPGIGAGGASNDTPLGIVGILSEDDDPTDPDDNGAGGMFHVDFRVGYTEPGANDYPLGPTLCLQSFDVIDAESGEFAIARIDVGPRDQQPDSLVIDITGAGNNAVQRVWVNECNVHGFVFGNSASVAIDNIVVCQAAQ